MRIVLTADTHFPMNPNRGKQLPFAFPEGDVLIHAGDLMYEGTPDEWQSRVDSLAKQEHKVKIYVPGNHDYFPYHYEGVARAQLRKAGIILMTAWERRTIVDEFGNKYVIVAHPGVTNLPGWAYNVAEEYMDNALMEHGAFDGADIIVTHAPPYRILDQVRPLIDVGCMAYNRWFYQGNCTAKLWAFGHIHESYGHTTIAGTTFVNAAMCDRGYKQVNKPIVYDMNLNQVV